MRKEGLFETVVANMTAEDVENRKYQESLFITETVQSKMTTGPKKRATLKNQNTDDFLYNEKDRLTRDTIAMFDKLLGT